MREPRHTPRSSGAFISRAGRRRHSQTSVQNASARTTPLRISDVTACFGYCCPVLVTCVSDISRTPGSVGYCLARLVTYIRNLNANAYARQIPLLAKCVIGRPIYANGARVRLCNHNHDVTDTYASLRSYPYYRGQFHLWNCRTRCPIKCSVLCFCHGQSTSSERLIRRKT